MKILNLTKKVKMKICAQGREDTALLQSLVKPKVLIIALLPNSHHHKDFVNFHWFLVQASQNLFLKKMIVILMKSLTKMKNKKIIQILN